MYTLIMEDYEIGLNIYMQMNILNRIANEYFGIFLTKWFSNVVSSSSILDNWNI